MVYPTSITVKQHRECAKAYAYYGEKALLSALVNPNPPLLTGSEVRFALARIACRAYYCIEWRT